MRYTKNDNYWNEPTVENSYWAGFIAADGNVNFNTNGACRVEVELVYYDESILKALSDSLEYSGPIHYIPKRQSTIKYGKYTGKIRYGKDSVRLRLCSARQYAHDLHKWYNITPAKSLTLLPPDITDPDLIRAYIFGYFQGDGSLSWDKFNKHWRISFSGKSAVLPWIKEHFTTVLGLRGSIRPVELTYTSTAKILDYFSPLFHLPHLTRKTNFDEYWKHRENMAKLKTLPESKMLMA